MSNVHEAWMTATPRDRGAASLDDRAFAALLAAMFVMLLAATGSGADAIGPGAPGLIGPLADASLALSTCPL